MSGILSPFAHDVGGGQDPLFYKTVALVHFDSSSGSPRTFPNQSPIGTAFQSGSGTNPDISSTQSRFGGFSLTYSSTSGNPVCASVDSDYATAGTAGDLTTEFWIRLDSVGTQIVLLDHRTGTPSANGYNLQVNATGVVSYRQNAIDRITSASSSIAINTWTHIAFCRASGTSRLFVAGSQVGSNFTDSLNLNSTTVTCLNAINGAVARTNCYMDELRITNAARYTANFTPAIVAFPNS